jgi:hypothetical protein
LEKFDSPLDDHPMKDCHEQQLLNLADWHNQQKRWAFTMQGKATDASDVDYYTGYMIALEQLSGKLRGRSGQETAIAVLGIKDQSYERKMKFTR